MIQTKQKLGILGGGQLGLMLIESIDDEFETFVLDKNPKAPSHTKADHLVVGDWTDQAAVYDFGKNLDVITIEIESVNADGLKDLESAGKAVYPSSKVVRLIQNKRLQKEFYQSQNLPTSPFVSFESLNDSIIQTVQYPCVFKSAKDGYDGQGVQVCQSAGDLKPFVGADGLIEEFVDFEREISVIVARDAQNQMQCFPVVDMIFEEQANLVEFVSCPSTLPESIQEQAQDLAQTIAQKLNLVGVLAVEFFITKDQKIFINEVAPRPHNSGHQTIEGNQTSQYKQLVKILHGDPLGQTNCLQPCVQLNLLGAVGFEGTPQYKGLQMFDEDPQVFIHLYGKTQTKPFRKMGHVTVLDDDLQKALEKAKLIKKTIQVESV